MGADGFHEWFRSEGMMVDFSELVAPGAEPKDFEEYLDRYAARVGDLVNAYIPHGTHPDMDKYLYAPLLEFSRNGGKRCYHHCCLVFHCWSPDYHYKPFRNRPGYGSGRIVVDKLKSTI